MKVRGSEVVLNLLQEVIWLASERKPKNIDILGKKFKCKFRSKYMFCHFYFALALTEESWVRNAACKKLLLTQAEEQRKPHAQTARAPLQPTSRAISLKDTMPFLDVSRCSVWALEGAGGHCKYRREPTGPNLPLSRHVLVSEDTQASLVEIKRKSYLQPVLIRPNYLYATIVSKVNPENKILKNYIVFINGYSKIKPWHFKGWPEMLIALLWWFSLKLMHLLLVLPFHFCNPTTDFDLSGLQLSFWSTKTTCWSQISSWELIQAPPSTAGKLSFHLVCLSKDYRNCFTGIINSCW